MAVLEHATLGMPEETSLLTLPEIITRPEQAYAYIPFTVSMNQLQTPADQGFPKLFSALAAQDIAISSAPFYNYRRIDMADTLDIEVGAAVPQRGRDADGLTFATLPAGRYATLKWHGHFDALEPVTGVLVGWVRQVGERFDVNEAADGDHFACRLEIYETDPSKEPDPQKWVTTLAFKLAD